MNDLSSSDGLHDPLTGAMALQAFYEAAGREISRVTRNATELFLMLISLPISTPQNNSEKIIDPSQIYTDKDQLFVALVELVNELKLSLRDNDLICRTGLAEISIIFNGNAEILSQRVNKIASDFSATTAVVKYQKDWKLPHLLTAGDEALLEQQRHS